MKIRTQIKTLNKIPNKANDKTKMKYTYLVHKSHNADFFICVVL